MTPPRRFARLRRGSVAEVPGYSVVPENGLCLSTCLVIRPPREDRRVLLGRLDPRAPWLEIGGLDPTRVARIGDSWMLPSSQLLFFETPEESAHRIAREQLYSELPPIEGTYFNAEAYPSAGHPNGDPHWDFYFVYRARWPTDEPPRAAPFRSLEFADLDRVRPVEIARGQGDVLALAGLAPGPSRTPAVKPPATSGPARTRRR